MLTEIFFILSLTSTRAVEPIWRFLCNHTSEYVMFVFGCFISQMLGYSIGCVPFLVLDWFRLHLFSSYKIQKANYPSSAEVLKATKDVTVSFVTVIFPMLALGGFFLPHLGITRDGPLPTWHIILLQVSFFFVVEDYLNYWLHRWLHTPWLYRHVHSVHHMYDAPFSIVAANAHPAEVVILAIPTFVGPLILSPHLYTLMLWQLFRNFEAIDIHSGYELPYSLKSLFPAYAGAQHHDYHHFMHSGNFASVFTWCDHLYGTDLGYKNYKARRKVD